MPGSQEKNVHFRLMSWMFGLRDLIYPRIHILEEAGIQKGYHVLDFGCGSGSYIFPLADLVGPSGKIYALDIHPLAVRMVEERAAKRRLGNVITIHSDGPTGLPDQSLDRILLYDVFHDLDGPGIVLKELRRVLKTDGILSFSDHHLKEDEVISSVTGRGLFEPAGRGRKTFSFRKIG